MLFDTRHGTSFDYVAGIRHDAPGRGGLVPLDVIWYSSDRVQLEVVANPDRPAFTDYGFLDEPRHRFILAGGIVVVIGVPGPGGEPDSRWLCLVDEPLTSVPASSNPFRSLLELQPQEVVRVTSSDPAGFSTSLDVWLRGGPSGLLLPSARRHTLLTPLSGSATRSLQRMVSPPQSNPAGADRVSLAYGPAPPASGGCGAARRRRRR